MRHKRLLTFSIAIVVLWGLSRLVVWPSAMETFSDADLLLVVLGLLLTFFWPLIGAARWQQVLKAFRYEARFMSALNAIMIAFAANLFAPAKSGDFVKVLAMGNDANKSELTAGVFAERLGDLIVLGLFAFVGGVVMQHAIPAAIGACLVIVLVLAIGFNARIHWKFKRNWLQGILNILTAASVVWTRNYHEMFMAMLWSIVNWGLAAIQIWLFFTALGTHITFLTVFALFPMAVLISLLPITPGGIGVRESAFVFFFLPYAEPHTSIAVSLGYFICNTGLTAVIGVIFHHLYSK